MVAAYSCADLFVIPSLEDNLPNTIMESMACGTPCVGFATGGVPEMIDHDINGYVANYMDADDLANGIQWILNNPNPQALSDACVKKVQENYTEEVVAKQYIAFYGKLLQKNFDS
ncbi:glycosyltransferase [uncultured Parabacteroides sp.]|uniref:glycosyltransferase n=1 Tax=uncultured Parabacteroides sp. TaxID=512312 RepID=UPI00265A8833|nr:glycosyltransferase [uncultured Parabacteroides sp.]